MRKIPNIDFFMASRVAKLCADDRRLVFTLSLIKTIHGRIEIGDIVALLENKQATNVTDMGNQAGEQILEHLLQRISN